MDLHYSAQKLARMEKDVIFLVLLDVGDRITAGYIQFFGILASAMECVHYAEIILHRLGDESTYGFTRSDVMNKPFSISAFLRTVSRDLWLGRKSWR